MIVICVLALCAAPLLILVADLTKLRRPADQFAGEPVGPLRAGEQARLAAAAAAAAAAPAPVAEPVAARPVAPQLSLVDPLPERRQRQLPYVGVDRRRSGSVDLRRPIAVPANMDAAALDAMLRDLGADPATAVVQRVQAG